MSGTRSAAPLAPPLIILFVLACAMLAGRAVIGVSTGGQGTLGLVAILAPLAAAATVARYGTRATLGFLGSPIFVLGVAPYLALTALLPILGVMFNRFPERTLWSVTDATTAFSFLVLGAALAHRDDRSWWPWILGAIAIQLAYAMGQALYLAHGPGWELFSPFHAWDLSFQSRFGAFVEARGSGLYFNPNELGLWAGFALIVSLTLLPSRAREVGVGLSLLTLLLSQSRGATVALVAALLVGGFLALAGGRLRLGGALRTVASVGAVSVVAVLAAFVIVPPGALATRFGALVNVLNQGARADANLAGRLDYWAAVSALNSVYPWGTWGSPEILLGTAVDSSWYRAFAQGSVPYVAALGLLLLATFALGSFRHRIALRMIAVLVAVAGLTQTPVSYPPIAIFWVLLGAGLQASVANRAPSPIVQPIVRRRPAPRDRRGTADGALGPTPAATPKM
jgi:hypothetical protein